MNNLFLTKLKQNKYLRYLGLLVILYMAYAIYIWSNTQTTDNAYVDADISLVSPEISGVIKQVLVIENSEVEEGQIIAEIDDEDFKADLEKAKTQVLMAEAAIKITEQKIAIEQINADKAKAELLLAKTNYDLAFTDYNRTIELNKDKFTSQKLLDNAKARHEQTKAEYNQAALDVSMSEKNLLLLLVEKTSNEAGLQGFVQLQNIAARDLENTKLKAPVSGRLGNSGLRVGNYVRPGVVLYTIIPKNLYVKANFKETQIKKFKPGMKVELKFDLVPEKKINGTIRSFAPATGSKFSLLPQDNATGNFTKIVQRIPVIIDFDLANIHHNLVPGMSTIVSVKTNQKL